MSTPPPARLGPSSSEPLASVVVPNWNGAKLIEDCLESLLGQTYPRVEVIVADGGSADESRAMVARFPNVRWLGIPVNHGFAGNVNAGLRAARGQVLLPFNNDARAEPGWVEASVRALEQHPEAGSIASKILFADGCTINSAGDGLTRSGEPFQRGAGLPDGPRWNTSQPVFGASGGAAAYRRAMLEDVGLLDEWLFAYLEDVDLAFRAQLRGWSCWFEPAATVQHLGSATAGGPMASYLNGRNLLRVLVKNVPDALVPTMLPGVLRVHTRRTSDALQAWRGPAARATLRGMLAGMASLPLHLAARKGVQQRRCVDATSIYSLLSPSPDS